MDSAAATLKARTASIRLSTGDNGGVRPPAGYKNPPSIDPSFDNFNSTIRIGPNYGKAPRVYNWSFTIQHEIKNTLLEVAYVGNRSHGLNSTLELNQLPTSYLSLGTLLGKNILDPQVVALGYKEPFAGFAAGWRGGATLAQALRPYPQYGNVSDLNAGQGKLWYDALQSKVERRFGGWQLIGSFVWSKNLDLLHYRQIFSQSTNVQTQDAYNFNEAKSYSPIDLPYVLNILNSYELPFGRGKKFLGSSNRLANLAVGGWVISSAQQYRSGGLIQVVTPGNPLGSGALFSRLTKANTTGAPISTGVSRTDLDPNNPNVRWINPGAFTVAAPYTLGAGFALLQRLPQPGVLQREHLDPEETSTLPSGCGCSIARMRSTRSTHRFRWRERYGRQCELRSCHRRAGRSPSDHDGAAPRVLRAVITRARPEPQGFGRAFCFCRR